MLPMPKILCAGMHFLYFNLSKCSERIKQLQEKKKKTKKPLSSLLYGNGEQLDKIMPAGLAVERKIGVQKLGVLC